MFVAEKDGRVRVVTADGTLLPTPLLDISNQVNSYHDRGLLGIAVDKDFETNGHLYLLYTYDLSPLVADSSDPMVARLTRVSVTPQNQASGETVLLGTYDSGPCPLSSNTTDCIPSNDSSHSIGTVRSDPVDGTLWVGVGDSSSYNTVDELAYRTYDEHSLAGKILHVDRDGNGLPGHPFCPSDANLTHACTKLHAKGFRNPYRFTLRPGKAPVVGDVQWEDHEEVNLVQPGGNYGWPCRQGSQQTPGYRDDSRCQDLYTANSDLRPLLSYPHFDGSGNNSSAVVGGPQLGDAEWPAEYRDSLYFGDYAKGFLRRIRVNAADECLDHDGNGNCVALAFADGWYGGVDLQAAPGGGLLYVEFGDGGPNGSIKRISYDVGNRRPVAAADASPLGGALPLSVSFSSAGSSDPDGDPLTYEWDFGDGSPDSSDPNPTHIYEGDGPFTATLTVRDGELSDTDTVRITPNNTTPVANLIGPVEGALYRAGETVSLSGAAIDAEDGALTGASLSWRVVLHHGQHTHPLTTLSGAQPSFTAATDHDADSFYEITLTATDSGGLSDSASVTIRPETAQFELRSSPEAGAPVSYGGAAGNTPMQRTAAVGHRTTVSAAHTYDRLGKQWLFDSWSDGGTRTHNLTIPAGGSTLTANYRENKAFGRPAFASSSYTNHPPELATDGLASTRWSSGFTDNQWWEVDLGRPLRVDTVEVEWETAYASRYRILTSVDGANYSEAADVSITKRGLERTSFPERNARFVRILGVTRATGWGISFHEARVIGGEDPPPPVVEDKALGRPAIASSAYNAGLAPGNANDGNSSTRWSSRFADGQWWQVDLGAPRTIDSVEINWENAHARHYRVLTSPDGQNFTEAAEQFISGPGFAVTQFPSRTARYVRILAVQRATAYGVSFWDARVWGPPEGPPPAVVEKATGKPASASTSYAGHPPGAAVDADATTRWSSLFQNDQWWQVDLGGIERVDTVEIDWENAHASRYRILTSTDGSAFTQVAEVTRDGAGLETTSFSPVDARYLRVLAVTRATPWGVSFWSLRAFGPAG